MRPYHWKQNPKNHAFGWKTILFKKPKGCSKVKIINVSLFDGNLFLIPWRILLLMHQYYCNYFSVNWNYVHEMKLSYLGLLVFLFLCILCGVGGHYRSGIFDDLSIFEYNLTFDSCLDLFFCSQFYFLFRYPFLWKWKQKC